MPLFCFKKENLCKLLNILFTFQGVTMPLKNLLLALLILPIFIGCESESTTEPKVDGVIMPITQGNSWDYKITASDSSSSGFEERILTHTMLLQTDTTISNQKWHILKGFFGPDDSLLIQNTSDGMRVFEADTAALVFKYPAQANTSYSLPDENNTIKVISTNALVTVPKGQFTCYHYRQERVISPRVTIIDFYLAPNIGIVKIDQVRRRTNAGETSTERVLFELSKAHD
jgi:hypothetical protein